MNGRRLHPAEIQRLLAEAEQHLRAGRLAESESACRRVLAQAPANPLATHYLGAIAFSTGKFDAALQLLHRAVELDPDQAAYWGAYGEALMRTNHHREAAAAYQRAVQLDPNNVAHQYTYGALTGKLGMVDESIAALRRSIQLKQDLVGAHNDLGITLTSARRLDEALESFRRASAIAPNYRSAQDNLLYFMHFQHGIDGMTIRAAAEAWAQRLADPLTAQAPPHQNNRDPNRRLRIGYVSSNLYEHPVGRFMLPILEARDRAQFEIFCYSDAEHDDAVLQALRTASDHWVDTIAMSDEALAQRVRDDQIDVLIDLTLHMGNNRLLAFARKPAPVQATYLGYAGTSGMRAMDWRISDPHLDPPGNDRFYTERTYRLPRSYWCYSPPPAAMSLGEVPARKPDAPVTFACLNNIMKFSDAALEAWAQILAQVPGSGMMIQSEPGAHVEVMGKFFERAGVERSRIAFAPKRSLVDYFLLYQHIDIALDPFPYAGGTTTCDALWMGVPVITLAGEIAVHRGGVSILSNLDLPELITTSPQKYIETAVALARDVNRFTSLRRELRPRMERSILMQPQAFIRDLESGFREIWRNWSLR